MSQYRIAIADDEMFGKQGRQAIYKELFADEFEVVQYASTPEEINEICSLNVHAYILDLYYLGRCQGIQIEDVLERIQNRRRTPIILVSGRWTDEQGENISILNKLKKYNDIVCFFGWDEIDVNNNEKAKLSKYKIINRIKYELDKFYSRVSNKVSPDETIRILQISDLQFGDGNIDPYSRFAKWDIPTFLNDKKISPHILVITGDISSHGKKSEFETANQWINNFCKLLWNGVEEIHEKLVIVPGNHDVDMNFCLADEYKYVWEKGFVSKAVKKQEQERIYQQFSLFNYAEFMRKLTGDISYIDNYSELFFVNERFLNWGIRFFELNTAQNIAPNNNDINIQDSAYDKMRNYITDNENEKIFNIMVGHHSPSSLGFQSDDGQMQDKWGKMFSFIESSKINMYLYGHQHQVSYGILNDNTTGAFFAKKMIYSLASTFCLNPTARPKAADRGFTLIELKRQEGIVYEVVIKPYSLKSVRPEPMWEEEENVFKKILY